MKPEIPEHISEQASLDAAIALCVGGKVSMGKAACLVGMNRSAFMHELGRRKVPLNYDVEDFEADMKTLSQLHNK